MITFTIPGQPFAKQRPHFSRKTRTAYTPAETVSFERTVGQYAMQHFTAPITGPVRLTVHATFKPPKSWTKKKTAEHLNRPHIQRPDGDNLIKAISDGLNRIAFNDDAQVYEHTVRKIWGPTAQTVVHIEAV